MFFPEAVCIVCSRCKWNRAKCKSCPVLRTVEDYDAEVYSQKLIELMSTMTIHKEGAWYLGTISGHAFGVKLASEDSAFGINEGRIIKMFVSSQLSAEGPGKVDAVSFERGWLHKPETREYEEIADALYEFFQNHCEVEE